MSVRLRLSPHRRIPSSQQIYYRIVACNGPRARDSKPLDTVGAYDPIPQHIPVVPASERSLLDEGKKLETRWIKRVEWDREKVQYWIRVGAQPTKRVAWLLQKDNLIPPGKTYHGYSGPSKPKSKKAPSPASTSTPETNSQQPATPSH